MRVLLSLYLAGMSASIALSRSEGRLLGPNAFQDSSPVLANTSFASSFVKAPSSVPTAPGDTRVQEARSFRDYVGNLAAVGRAYLTHEHPEASFTRLQVSDSLQSRRTTSTLIPWLYYVVAYREVVGHDHYTEKEVYEFLNQVTDEEFVVKLCQDIQTDSILADFAKEMMAFMWLKSKTSPEEVFGILHLDDAAKTDKDALLHEWLRYCHQYRNFMLTTGASLKNFDMQVYTYRILGLARATKMDEELEEWLLSIQEGDGLTTFASNLAKALDRDSRNQGFLVSLKAQENYGIKEVFTSLGLHNGRIVPEQEKVFQWLRFCSLCVKETSEGVQLSVVVDAILDLLTIVYPKKRFASLFSDVSHVPDMKTFADKMKKALTFSET